MMFFLSFEVQETDTVIFFLFYFILLLFLLLLLILLDVLFVKR